MARQKRVIRKQRRAVNQYQTVGVTETKTYSLSNHEITTIVSDFIDKAWSRHPLPGKYFDKITLFCNTYLEFQGVILAHDTSDKLYSAIANAIAEHIPHAPVMRRGLSARIPARLLGQALGEFIMVYLPKPPIKKPTPKGVAYRRHKPGHKEAKTSKASKKYRL